MKRLVYEYVPSVSLNSHHYGSLQDFIKELQSIQDSVLLKYPDAQIICNFDFDEYYCSLSFNVTHLETDEQYNQRLKDEAEAKKQRADQAKEKRKQRVLEEKALYEKLKAKFEK